MQLKDKGPEFIKCSLPFAAMMQATIKFAGRDRRRLRREQLKAWAKARKQESSNVVR